MKLTIEQRHAIIEHLPQETSKIEYAVKSDILKKVDLSLEEMKSIDYQTTQVEGGKLAIKWHPEKGAKLIKEVKFTGTEKELLKTEIEKADKEKRWTGNTQMVNGIIS